jgi:hypothetical protein
VPAHGIAPTAQRHHVAQLQRRVVAFHHLFGAASAPLASKAWAAAGASSCRWRQARSCFPTRRRNHRRPARRRARLPGRLRSRCSARGCCRACCHWRSPGAPSRPCRRRRQWPRRGGSRRRPGRRRPGRGRPLSAGALSADGQRDLPALGVAAGVVHAHDDGRRVVVVAPPGRRSRSRPGPVPPASGCSTSRPTRPSRCPPARRCCRRTAALMLGPPPAPIEFMVVDPSSQPTMKRPSDSAVMAEACW